MNSITFMNSTKFVNSIITNCLPLFVWSHFIITSQFWSHFSCRTFLCKINNNAQLWKFGLSTGLYLSSPNKGSHFTCRTFLSKISTHKYLWRFGQSTGPYLSMSSPKKGHTLHVAFFWAKFQRYVVLKVWSVNWTIPVSPNKGSHFTCRTFLSKISRIYSC